MSGFPGGRPRRLRRTAAMRSLVAQTRLSPADLVLPLFVADDVLTEEVVAEGAEVGPPVTRARAAPEPFDE